MKQIGFLYVFTCIATGQVSPSFDTHVQYLKRLLTISLFAFKVCCLSSGYQDLHAPICTHTLNVDPYRELPAHICMFLFINAVPPRYASIKVFRDPYLPRAYV